MKQDGQRLARRREAIGFLMRLRRDVRGGAAVMLAAMVIPLLLFAGSAVDVSRVYTVKARLQQACDAGVLAGRRSMTDTSTTGATATVLDASATAQANAFFNSNFHVPTNTVSGWMQTTVVTVGTPIFTPSKVLTPEAQVSGTASVKVPMAVMKMFGFQPVTLTATCEARYDTRDTDIMFVLDQTGSMACLTSDDSSPGGTCDSYVGGNVVQNADGSYSVTEKSGARIQGLRAAVLNFFDTLTSSASASTNFRFGFVPYAATANVGKLLQPLGYVATVWNYQSRDVFGDANNGSASSSSVTSTSAACTTGVTRSPATGYTSSGTATVTTVTYGSGKCTTSSQPVVPNWIYRLESFPTASYIAGGAVDNPAQVDATTSTWNGCIEERIDSTSRGDTSFSTTSPPLDLDVDTAPTSNFNRWGPMWTDVEFAKLSTNETTSAARTVTARPYGSTMYEGFARTYNEIGCPLAAKRLTAFTLAAGDSKSTVRTAIQNYLLASNGFRPYGQTYHDVGMTWGTRLLSPTGIFASDTVAWPGHNTPNRYLIFLTDGAMESDAAGDGLTYSEFGMEKYDGRVAGGATSPSLDTFHNNRFAAACTIAKSRGITIFVIGYAQTLTPQLSACASPGLAYYASNTATLNAKLTQIAQQVSQLRISK